MTACDDTAPGAASDGFACPADGSPGQLVRALTVAANVRGPMPAPQRFKICCSRDCEIVYFGDAGDAFSVGDVDTVPGFKAGSDGLVCYCFGHREVDLRAESGAAAPSRILAAVEARVETGDCYCAVKSPSGRCCLGNLRALVEATRSGSAT